MTESGDDLKKKKMTTVREMHDPRKKTTKGLDLIILCPGNISKLDPWFFPVPSPSCLLPTPQAQST